MTQKINLPVQGVAWLTENKHDPAHDTGTLTVGKDCTFAFAKNICDKNHQHFNISPFDRIVTLDYRTPTDECVRLSSGSVQLPTCLFTESAIKAGRIWFQFGTQSYDLRLISSNRALIDPEALALRPGLLQPKHDSFECEWEQMQKHIERGDEGNFCFFAKDFPDNDCFKFPVRGKHSYDIYLSSHTKRIQLNQNGVSVYKPSECVISSLKDPRPMQLSAYDTNANYDPRANPHPYPYPFKEDHVDIKLEARGGQDFEMLLDGQFLYVLSHPNNEQSEYIGDRLFRLNLSKYGRTINEQGICSSLVRGILTINIPFHPQGQPAAVAAPAAVVTQQQPAKHKVHVTARCNAGLGHHLYIRGEGLPDLSWNKGIRLQCRGTDAWIWETEAADLSKVKYKLLLDDKTWEEAGNRSLKDGKQEVTPKFPK